MPFYDKIDFDGEYLYSINYLGINSTLFSGKRSLIKDFKNKIKAYNGLSITKFVLFWAYYITYFFIFILESKKEIGSNNIFVSISTCIKSKRILIIVVWSLILLIPYSNILTICAISHVEYIEKFMNDINLDFKRERNGYVWNFIVLFFFALSFLYLCFRSSIIKSLEFYDLIIDDNIEETNGENNNNNNNAQAEEVIIKFRNNHIIESLNEQEFQNVEENPISVIFTCTDQTFNYPIICKKNQKFSEVENLLYEQYPQYKNTNNFFLCHGNIIDSSKTMKENKLNHGDIIVMTINQVDS